VGVRAYRGHDGVREAVDTWFEVWEWMRVEIADIREEEDRSLVTLHQVAKGRASEVEVEVDTYNVFRFGDGKVTSMELFTDPDGAAAAFDAVAEGTPQQQ
jgi:ketosteroid isomerase-like protein